MSNVKPVLNCPVCEELGTKTKDYGRIAAMKCPKCGHEWSTLKVKK